MRKILGYSILFFLFTVTCPLSTAYAIVNPLSVPNNKFGIHIISASPDESSPAAQLANTNGDWGYITVLIESKDRNENKWQEFFNDLRRRHLIPLVRLATKPVNEYWERPYEGEEQAWADFLDSLNWPTKNRYVIIYNEPNHGKEWGNFVDPKMYAKVLDQTITALKNKNRDFFVLNSGFDASAPSKPPLYEDQVKFMQQTEEAVPGIFKRLDGWVSHSYPNPAFAGSPDDIGRATVRTWLWELQLLRQFGVTKNLPVFITETGWVHAEGINYNSRYPTADTVAGYFKSAFEYVWTNPRIVAVTPFLLSYQESPFDHFSFKNPLSPDYYPQYQTIMDLDKTSGKPVQENKAQLTQGEVFSSVVVGESYNISLTFRNTGQSIWDGQVTLRTIEGGKELGIAEVPVDKIVEPGQDYTFQIHLQAPEKGNFKVALQMFSEGKQFDTKPIEFTTEVKEPVILKILTKLKWRDSAAGEYILRTTGTIGESTQKVTLDKNGGSENIEARYLLPDYTFEFSLEKPNYKPKTITKKLQSGENVLDFGILQPDLLSNLFNLKELWQLLPFSN